MKRWRRHALAGVIALALGLQAGSSGGVFAAEPTPTPSPAATPSPTPSPTATPTPSPTQMPSSDLAVMFFNNFCQTDQPLMVTVFNTNQSAMAERELRIRLLDEHGLVEQHDRVLSLPGQGNVNLPLTATAQPPWLQVEISFLSGPDDPNSANDVATCEVADASTEETPTPEPTAEAVAQPVTHSAAPPAPQSAAGSANDAVWRKAAPESTAAASPPAQVVPTLAPRVAPATGNNAPQPSLTPVSDAGGGLAPAGQGGLPRRMLMLTGVVLLAAGSSWGFYYLTRPSNAHG